MIEYRLETRDFRCNLHVIINGNRYHSLHFGHTKDMDCDKVEGSSGGCGDMQFFINHSDKQKVYTLDKLGINEDEYDKIAIAIKKRLMIGRCDKCS